MRITVGLLLFVLIGACGDDDPVGDDPLDCPGIEECGEGQVCKCSMDATVDVPSTDVPDADVPSTDVPSADVPSADVPDTGS